MKYDHAVKHNGSYYPAGADVPAGDVFNGSAKSEDSQIEFETNAVAKKTR